jgi:hypothetical protein
MKKAVIFMLGIGVFMVLMAEYGVIAKLSGF